MAEGQREAEGAGEQICSLEPVYNWHQSIPEVGALMTQTLPISPCLPAPAVSLQCMHIFRHKQTIAARNCFFCPCPPPPIYTGKEILQKAQEVACGFESRPLFVLLSLSPPPSQLPPAGRNPGQLSLSAAPPKPWCTPQSRTRGRLSYK